MGMIDYTISDNLNDKIEMLFNIQMELNKHEQSRILLEV